MALNDFKPQTPYLFNRVAADMPAKGQSCIITYYAWNTNTSTFRSGDSANHTLRLVKDATSAAPTNAAAAVDNTNTPGLYMVALTSAETQFNTVAIGGISTTASTVIFGTTISFSNLPVFNPGTNQGILTLGTGIGQVSTTSGFASANVAQWQNLPPAALVNALVQTAQSGQFSSLPQVNTTQIGGVTSVTSSAMLGVNIVTVGGAAHAPLIGGLVQATVSGVGNANVVQWNSAVVQGQNPPDALITRGSTAFSGTTTSITLDSGASRTDNFYLGQTVIITAGSGAGEAGVINAYSGLTQNASVLGGFAVAPSANSKFVLVGTAEHLSHVTRWQAIAPAALLNTLVQTAQSGQFSSLPSVNLTQWEGVAPAPLSSTFVQTVQSGQFSSLPSVNLTQWEGIAPAPLLNALVQTVQSGQPSTVPTVNVTQWQGTSPAPLVNALLQTLQSGQFSTVPNVNTTQIGGITTSTSAAMIGVNLVTWEGAVPAPLVAALVQTMVSGAVTATLSSITSSAQFGVNVATFGGTPVTPRDIGASVIVGTNNDKTGYSLTQSFPSNFATMGINASGAVTIDGGSALTESYAVVHAAPNLQQLLFEVRGLQAEKSVVGTTMTINKIDGATTAETFTLNNAVNPTSLTRKT